jgi:hypothetical protein
MSLLNTLAELIQHQLAEPRPLPRQVETSLLSDFVTSTEAIPAFMATTVATLDDTTQDLLLSPAYTPTQPHKAVCAHTLTDSAMALSETYTLVEKLDAQRPVTPFIISDGTSCHLPVPEVCLQRYVRLLGLTSPIHLQVFQHIQQHVPSSDQPVFNLLARDAVWQTRADLLLALLPVIASTDKPADTMVQITGFVHTYRPKNRDDMAHQLESYIRSCETDLIRAGEMTYHDDRLKEKYAYHHEGHGEHSEAHLRANFMAMMDKGRMMLNLLQAIPTHAA